jgi:uncharacterized membrane protein affecting hemolysin expression
MRSSFIGRQNLVRVLAVALAVVALIFVVQTFSHSHPNGQEQAACQLCQIAHTGILATSSTPLPVAPLAPTGQIRQRILVIHEEEFSLASPSRAPPAV